MTDKTNDTRAIQTGYDIATLFKAATWIIMMRDQRPPQVLVQMAFNESKDFIEAHVADQTRDRRALMRGLLTHVCVSQGVQPDPGFIEMMVGLVVQVVDKGVTSQWETGLQGESA